jgi:hypothetical protein
MANLSEDIKALEKTAQHLQQAMTEQQRGMADGISRFEQSIRMET